MTALSYSHSTFSGELPVTLAVTQTIPVSIGPRNADCSRLAPPDQDQLVAAHMSVVHAIARREHGRLPSHVSLEDLVSAGTFGLLDAVARFDYRRPVQFMSYAQFRVRGAIIDYLRESGAGSRMCRRVHREMEATKAHLTALLGRTPAESEIADEMHVELGTLQRWMATSHQLSCGDNGAHHTAEADQVELDRVPAPATDDPLLQCIAAERRERMRALIDELPEKQRLVLCLYYYEELTMKEIGEVLSLPESRVSQLHAAALSELRRAMAASAASKSPATQDRGGALQGRRSASHEKAGW